MHSYLTTYNRISDVMARVLTTSVVNRAVKPRSDQTKSYEIGICCFSAKHAALRSKNKDCLDGSKSE